MDEEQKDLIPEEEENPRPGMNRFYIIRILIGGYIAYLGSQLLKSYIKGTATVYPVLILIAAIVFLLAGTGLVLWSVWLMVKEK